MLTRPRLLIVCSLLASCTSIPEVGGRPADTYSSDELLVAAQAMHQEGRNGQAVAICDFIIRTRYAFARIEDVRYLSAESLFELGDYSSALVHYRRILDENRFTARKPEIGRRIWFIGKTLVRERASWFGDYNAQFDVGVDALNVIVTVFPRKPYADDAWKELARTFSEDGHYQSAVDCYEHLYREYPLSEWADYSLYEVSVMYRNQSRGVGYDVEPLMNSHGALARYLRLYPEGNFVAQALRDRSAIEEEFGEGELEIADFYRKRGDLDGESAHLRKAAMKYPDTEAAARARQALLELNLSTDEGTTGALRVLSEWGASESGVPQAIGCAAPASGRSNPPGQG